jgi:hypothetical protein
MRRLHHLPVPNGDLLCGQNTIVPFQSISSWFGEDRPVLKKAVLSSRVSSAVSILILTQRELAIYRPLPHRFTGNLATLDESLWNIDPSQIFGSIMPSSYLGLLRHLEH